MLCRLLLTAALAVSWIAAASADSPQVRASFSYTNKTGSPLTVNIHTEWSESVDPGQTKWKDVGFIVPPSFFGIAGDGKDARVYVLRMQKNAANYCDVVLSIAVQNGVGYTQCEMSKKVEAGSIHCSHIVGYETLTVCPNNWTYCDCSLLVTAEE